MDFILVDYKEDSATNTFNVSGDALMICNDSTTASLTVAVNSMTITVPESTSIPADELSLKKFSSVVVTVVAAPQLEEDEAPATYRLFVYERLVKQ